MLGRWIFHSDCRKAHAQNHLAQCLCEDHCRISTHDPTFRCTLLSLLLEKQKVWQIRWRLFSSEALAPLVFEPRHERERERERVVKTIRLYTCIWTFTYLTHDTGRAERSWDGRALPSDRPLIPFGPGPREHLLNTIDGQKVRLWQFNLH